MAAIKAILWDVDGTILNFKEAQKNALRTCFGRFDLGECSDEMLRDYDGINTRYWQALERGEIDRQGVLHGRFREFFAKYGLNQSVIAAFNEEYQFRLGDTICFYPGVLDDLSQFKNRGILQYAVTNGTKAAQDRKLIRSGLVNIFDDIYISEEIGYEKPNPLFFGPALLAIRSRIPDISTEEIMIVGDSLTSDIQGGINAGIMTCWFKHPGQMNAGGLKLDYIIEDFYELPEIVEGM